jgi:predicted deacylase
MTERRTLDVARNQEDFMSDRMLTVGSLSAGSGEKKFGVNEFVVQGQPFRLSMWLINGVEPGPTLVVTGGVHAAEYASIAAALDLGRNLEPGHLRGRVIIVPVMNVPGFSSRSIYVCPLDGKNLNRVFPGNAGGTASEQIAGWILLNVMKQADYYVDLHGGDLIEALVPFTIFFRSGNEQVDLASQEMAKAFGIHYLVRSETPGSTFSTMARAGIPAILTESGGQGIWTPEDVARHTEGMDRLMRHLNMIPGPAPESLPYTLLEQFIWLRSEHDGFWYPAVLVGDSVKEGQNLGNVKDYEGNILQSATSPADGRVLFIVTSLAINDGDPLLAVGA